MCVKLPFHPDLTTPEDFLEYLRSKYLPGFYDQVNPYRALPLVEALEYQTSILTAETE